MIPTIIYPCECNKNLLNILFYLLEGMLLVTKKFFNTESAISIETMGILQIIMTMMMIMMIMLMTLSHNVTMGASIELEQYRFIHFSTPLQLFSKLIQEILFYVK